MVRGSPLQARVRRLHHEAVDQCVRHSGQACGPLQMASPGGSLAHHPRQGTAGRPYGSGRRDGMPGAVAGNARAGIAYRADIESRLMPPLPLTSGAYSTASYIASAQRCVNMFPEKNPEEVHAETPVTHLARYGLRPLNV